MALPGAGFPLLSGDTQAAHQLLHGNGLVIVRVTVLHKLFHTLLGLGLLPQEPLKGLDFLLADVSAGVLIKQLEVPVYNPLLQGVAGVWLRQPAGETTTSGGSLKLPYPLALAPFPHPYACPSSISDTVTFKYNIGE